MDYTKIDLKMQNMMYGIKAQVPFVRHSPKVMYEDIKKRLALKAAPLKVYLTGCGDSWYCGMATRYAFEAWAKIPTEAPRRWIFRVTWRIMRQRAAWLWRSPIPAGSPGRLKA